MGACLSTVVVGAAARSSQSDRQRPTANVISANGNLREYTIPVTVSKVLQLEFPILSSSSSSSSSSSESAKFFVCNSECLYYDDYVPALDTEDELQADQIYFVLPVSKLRYRLTASDMAALAVKASVALQKSSSNPKKGSSYNIRHRRHRQGSQNKIARISPVIEDFNINHNTSIQGVQYSSSSSDGGERDYNYQVDREVPIATMKKGLSSDKPAAALGVSRSGSVKKVQRYSSRRAKMAVRSFRVRLTTIYEGSVLQFF